MFGVIGRVASAVKDEVVASLLLFEAKQSFGKPGQRIAPVNSRGEVAQELGQAVPALDVGQLVQKDHFQSVG